MATNHDTAGVLGSLEAEVMEILWSSDEPVAVRDVLEIVNRDRSPGLAYTTVMTVLARLAEKEILTRERHGRGYRYTAAAADPATIAVRGVVRDFGDAAIAGFVDEARADPALLDRLRVLLAEDGT